MKEIEVLKKEDYKKELENMIKQAYARVDFEERNVNALYINAIYDIKTHEIKWELSSFPRKINDEWFEEDNTYITSDLEFEVMRIEKNSLWENMSLDKFKNLLNADDSYFNELILWSANDREIEPVDVNPQMILEDFIKNNEWTDYEKACQNIDIDVKDEANYIVNETDIIIESYTI